MSHTRSLPVSLPPLVIAAMVAAAGLTRAAAAGDRAAEILDATGVRGGLVVHLGCGDGKLTAALRASDSYLVEGLDADAANVAEARAFLRSKDLCGPVSVAQLVGDRLPYADNLVSLLVAEDLGKIPMDEVMRVLAPGGVAYLGQKGSSPAAPQWTKIVKPWPEEIDDWSHFLHDASNNAVAHDRVVAAPKSLQWIAGPLWSRSHEYDSSTCAMVSSRGRLFAIFDEGPTGIIDKRVPDKWTLIARDAFNGVVLWKRAIPDWGWRAWKRAKLEEADWSRMPSQRTALPLAVPRRLVAASSSSSSSSSQRGDRVYVTLGYQAPLSALDAATGRTLKTYAGTEQTDEILHRDGLLVLCIRAPSDVEGGQARAQRRGAKATGPDSHPFPPATIVALEADTGRRLWQTETGTVVPLSLALSGPNVFYHDGSAVVSLDAASGKPRWRTPTAPAGGTIWNTNTTLVADKDVVLCASGKQVAGLSVADGHELWKLPGARGFGVANPPDLFVADGLVWYGQGNLDAESATITGYDPSTGTPVRTVDLTNLATHGHHPRCYRSKATDNYLLLPKRGIEFLDIQGHENSRQNWVRGACRFGLLPANGLLYGTPHPCFCYAGVKLGGFLALAPQRPSDPVDENPEVNDQRLFRGLAYGERGKGGAAVNPVPPDAAGGLGPSTLNSQPSTLNPSTDWTMYRHDPERSGSTSASVGCNVTSLWRTGLGGKLTQPVVAGGRLFVARVDAGEVSCLDAATGKKIWSYVTAGRIDSSPTICRGRLIFGSADGSVYCLRASDGELVWRFQAAPGQRRVVAFGRVESAWPVHGSVLITGGLAYFAVGRSTYLDGGITLYGLDPLTGAVRHKTRLESPEADTKKLDENAYAIEGAKSDILVTDGTLIYLFHNAFDLHLVKQPTPVEGEPGVRNLGVRPFGEHLFSNAGFLDDSWFSRSYWMVGDRWPAFNFAQQSPKAGQLIVFDDRQTYAVKCFVRRNMLSPLFFPATDGYFLVADRNDTKPVLVAGDGKGGPKFIRWLPQTGELQTCWNLGVGFARSTPAQWVDNVPVRIRAMVRAGDALFAAGRREPLPERESPADPTAALEARMGAVLMAVDPDDGGKLFECPLDTPPVFDGMIAAGDKLYLSLTDGSVLAMHSRDVPPAKGFSVSPQRKAPPHEQVRHPAPLP